MGLKFSWRLSGFKRLGNCWLDLGSWGASYARQRNKVFGETAFVHSHNQSTCICTCKAVNVISQEQFKSIIKLVADPKASFGSRNGRERKMNGIHFSMGREI